MTTKVNSSTIANTAVSQLSTSSFTILESNGKLVFKYGSTTIASLDSSGNLITISSVSAAGTP
jgi:hypothetical protein